MRHLLLIHTPALLEEFPQSADLYLSNKKQTQKRTRLLVGVLHSFGRYVRINLTCWVISTNETADTVYHDVSHIFNLEYPESKKGDIIVVEFSECSATMTQDVIEKLHIVCGIKSEGFERDDGVKTTDAMFRRLPGSFESTKS